MVDSPTRPAFQSHEVTALVRGGGVDIIPAGEFQTEEMILNIGPQHPATHGVLRIVIELDGEVIKRAEPVIGYMHRGAEKLAEYRDARQTLVLMNRHDWLSAFNNELGWTIAIERLAGIEVPDRAQWIRTMFAEWNRIMNHLVFMGSYPLELGAITPLFYTFREREMVQDLVESVTGARMHHSYARVGGLKDDLPRGFLSRAREVLAAVRGVVAEYETLIMGNEIIFARCRDIGIIPREMAIAYGCSGPTAQASGVAMDPRKDEPYEKYAEVEFDVPVGRARRLLRSALGVGRAGQAELRHHRAVHRQAPARSVPCVGAAQDAQDPRGRDLRAHREPPRCDGLLRDRRGQEEPVPREDAHGELLERQRHPGRATRRA